MPEKIKICILITTLLMILSCEKPSTKPPDPYTELIYTIPSTESFLQQIATIIESVQIETNIVIINVASVDITPDQLPPLVIAVSSIPEQENVTLNWTDIYPTEEQILIRFENQYAPLRKPPLRANPHKWAVLPIDLPKFTEVGQSEAIELYQNEIIFDIDSTESFLQQIDEIIETAQIETNIVTINVASIGVSPDQLIPLVSAVSSIPEQDNITLNWTDIYPTEEKTIIRYENHYEPLRKPPLRANPHRWAVLPDDYPKFTTAGQTDAIEQIDFADIIDFAIDSVSSLISQLPDIITASHDPEILVNVNFTSISVSAVELPPLRDAVESISIIPNVILNWTDIYPTERDILLDYDEDWSRLGMPPLAANPHKWSATAIDLPRFIAAGQGNSVEKEIEIFDFAFHTVAEFLSQLNSLNPKVEDPRNTLNINMNAMSITEAQLTPLVNGISPLHTLPNVTLNWINIYPTEQGIFLSYQNHWIPLGNPPLSANPHRWLVTAADLPLFQNAGQGHAVEQETRTILFEITSAQQFINAFPAIADSVNVPYSQVVVNVAQIEINQDQLGLLTEGVANMSSAVNLHWNGISSMSERILLRFHENWLPLRNPLLLSTPRPWTVPTLDIALFQAENQGNAVLSHLQSMDYHCEIHPDGALLEHITTNEIVWNKHLADASNLMHAVNWGWHVILDMGDRDWELPGGRRALGNMTGNLLKELHTTSVPTGGNLRANDMVIVTSFSPTNSFDPNSSGCLHPNAENCNHPAMPLRIDTLGDEGDTNWAFQHLQTSIGIVGSQGMTPHIKSIQEDGRIFFEPGGHFPDYEEPLRSRYSVIWFGNHHHLFKFGVLNDVTVVIQMNRLTLCTPYNTSPSVAYALLLELFLPSPDIYNVEIPALEDVKTALNDGNER